MRKHFLLLFLMALLPLSGWAADGDITEPTPKTGAAALTYTGSNQELLATAGSVEGVNYELRYAVTTSETATPEWSAFSTATPKGKNAGTYFVYFAWYNTETGAHSEIGPKVSVVIAKANLTAGTDYTAPEVITSGVTYNGKAQALITAGSVSSTQAAKAGTLTYKLDNVSTGSTVPTAINVKRNNAGAVQNYVVKYTLSGSDNYNSYTGTINVTLQPKEIESAWFTFDATSAAATRTYGGTWTAPGFSSVTPFVVDNTTNPATTVDVTYSTTWYTNTNCSEGATTSPSNATTYYAAVTGTGNFSGTVKYDATDRPWTFSISRKQVRLLVNPQAKEYNGQAQAPDAAADNFTAYGLTEDDAALGLTGLTVEQVTNTDVIKTVGKYNLKAAWDDNAKIGAGTADEVLLTANYEPVALEQGYIEITKKALTITVKNDTTIAYGAVLPESKALRTGDTDTDYLTKVTIEGALVNTTAAIDETAEIKKALTLGLKKHYTEAEPPVEIPAATYYNHKGDYEGCWAISYETDGAGNATNETLANYAISVTNKAFHISGAGFTMMAVYANKTYDGEDASNANLSYIALNAQNEVVPIPSTVTVEYEYQTDATANTWSSTLPSAVGTYKYRVKAKDAYATGNYEASKIEYEAATLKINPKVIKVNVDTLTLHTGDSVEILNKYAKITVDNTTPLVGSEKLVLYYSFNTTNLGTNWDGTTKKLVGTTTTADGIADAIEVRLVVPADTITTPAGIYAGQKNFDFKNNGNYELQVVKKGVLHILAGTTLNFDVADQILDRLEDADGTENATVQFKNTLYTIPAGEWRTLVLPFDITPLEFCNTIHAYAIFNKLTSANASANTVKFSLEQENLPANTPFLVKSPVAFDLDDISFAGRTIDFEETPTAIVPQAKFIGSYVDVANVPGGANVMWWKNSENNFVKATDGGVAKAFTNYCFHAYLVLDESFDPNVTARILVEEADGTVTAISSINADGVAVPAEGWYNLNGVKLQSAPTEKGIYINNGKKVVVK